MSILSASLWLALCAASAPASVSHGAESVLSRVILCTMVLFYYRIETKYMEMCRDAQRSRPHVVCPSRLQRRGEERRHISKETSQGR